MYICLNDKHVVQLYFLSSIKCYYDVYNLLGLSFTQPLCLLSSTFPKFTSAVCSLFTFTHFIILHYINAILFNLLSMNI